MDVCTRISMLQYNYGNMYVCKCDSNQAYEYPLTGDIGYGRPIAL